MSRMELQQLDQCMEHLAYILDQLGVTEARFSQGKISFEHNKAPVNQELLHNFCQHISNLRRDELAAGEDDLPEYYFD